MDLLLLPTPASLTRTGTQHAIPAALGVHGVDAALLATTLGGRARTADADHAEVHCQLDAAIQHPEGYRLVVGERPRVRIQARTTTGLRHGLATLNQILRQCGATLPGLVIEDAPAFPVRGVMLDISRDRVPTMDFLQELVAKLASWKINHLELYTEHTFAYRGHEAVWSGCSPMTPEEMRDLDRLCTSYGIELTANQNCLGHFERWLKIPGYGHLGERSSGQMAFGVWYVDPNTLAAGQPEVLALVKGLLDQLIPTCSGRFVHIGCDEPFDRGSGRSKALVERHGLHQVYARHVAEVAGYARAHGRRPLYWADAEHAKPELAAELPADIVPLIWDYGPEAAFAKNGQPFRDRGLETWVCPGTNCWGSFTARTWERRANLTCAAVQGRSLGSSGFLNTAWGDGGHRQQIPITLAGLADGAQSSWSGGGSFDDRALGLHAFGDPALGPWLIELGDIDLAARKAGGGVFGDLGLTMFDPHQPGDRATYEAMVAGFTRMRSSLPSGASALVREECAHACDMALYAAQRGLLRRAGPSMDQRKASALRLSELLAEHRRLWMKRSRYGGLESSSDRYRTLLAHY